MSKNESLKRGEEDTSRQNRELDERAQVEDRALTDEERLLMFRQSFFQDALPNLPPIPGYHTCWLTTTNPRDTIQMRTRLGYELIKADELGPAWVQESQKTGEHAGLVTINEMIAAKLPLSLYEAYMLEVHHTQPAQEQRKLTDTVDTIRREAEEQHKAKVIEFEGTAALRKEARAPRFVDPSTGQER